MLQKDENKSSRFKTIVIALFTIEQVIIIYIIATRKGMSVIDWFSNLF